MLLLPLLRARQASEQYFTSAQFLAQLLRQTMSRPQTKQGLLGSAALLPLKPVAAAMPLAQAVAVVMGIGAVKAAPQFHGQVVVSEGCTLYA